MGKYLYTVLVLSVRSIATLALFSIEQVLAEVKYSSLAWLNLLLPHLLLDTMGLLVVLGGVEGSKDLGADPSHWN